VVRAADTLGWIKMRLMRGDCLLQIIEKPKHIFGLDTIGKLLQLCLLRQRAKLLLDALELARRESALIVMGHRGIPHQFHPTSLLCHVGRTSIKILFQCRDMREKELDIFSCGDGPLNKGFVKGKL